jgi:hypothetical protein
MHVNYSQKKRKLIFFINLILWFWILIMIEFEFISTKYKCYTLLRLIVEERSEGLNMENTS